MIRMMASAALLLLAVSALAVEAQTKSHPVLFKDWMDGKSGKAKVANYYEESELQGACLRGLTYDKCAATGCTSPTSCAHLYFETDVGCCAEGYHKHQETFRLPEDLKVGRCWWTMDRLIGDPDKAFDTGVHLEGTYEMTCELEEDSEKCGEPLCDDLVLKGWGQTYLDYNAAIQGQPKIANGGTCTDGFLGRLAPEPRDAQTPAQKPAEAAQQPAAKTPVKIASADNYYHEEHATEYFPGRVRIFTGYVQVLSCSKKVVYKEGKMQAIGNYKLSSTTAIKPSPDQFIAKPYTMDFILRKSGDY